MITRGKLERHGGGRVPHESTTSNAAFFLCLSLGDKRAVIVLVDAVHALKG